MKLLEKGIFEGERALFCSENLKITDSVFRNGESPLKQSRGLEVSGCTFEWKYPLWYCKDVRVENTVLSLTARSGIWYTDNIEMTGCDISAPKTFRRCDGVSLYGCTVPNAQETMWSCKNIQLKDVRAVGDYFCMNCENIEVENLQLEGNYVFDGSKNIVVRNSRLISKDSFWNCENVTVYDSVIVGEYLGWNSKNLRFVNCTVESNQGMCFIDGLVMENCRLVNTDLAFEYCTVDADISSDVISIKNPISGRISVESCDEVIMEPERVDTSRTEIIVGGKRYDV